MFKGDYSSMKWIIVFFQILVSLPEGEIDFSGLTTGQKMLKEVECVSAYYETKLESEKNLKRLEGKKKF